MLCWEFVNETATEIQNPSSNSKRCLFQKLCQYTHTYLIPIYIHVLGSNDAVAGSRRQLGDQTQKDNQQHFGFNFCNSWKEVMCKLSLPFLPLCTVNTVKHSYGTSTFIPQLYWLNTDRILDIFNKSVQFFFATSWAKFHIPTSLWT